MSALKLDGAVAHRLWGGRFAGDSAPELDALNRSVDVDFRLWPFDIQLSKAWSVALWHAGVISLEESRQLEDGLETVAARLRAGALPQSSDEDVHTVIDRLLHEVTGEVASKLHTGRSRNDQVATAARLWAMDAAASLDTSVRRLQSVLLEHARTLHAARAIMPAYTHLQRAQPVEASHWVLSHFWPLDRDRQRLAASARAAAALPLGAGAIAGCPFPISRVLLQETLGFSRRTPNSIDAVSDRDFVADLLYAVTMLSVHLSRLAEDLVLFGTAEFGFVEFGERYTTGSSMMPQKRNPDVFEIARGTAGRILGDLTALLTTLKGLPTGYNKDLQDDKRALFDAVDTMERVLPALGGALAECAFRPDRMRAACSSTMMATDLADHLVANGVAFREAHAAVGRLVRESEALGVELRALPLKAFTAAHPQFTAELYEALSPVTSVERREVDGGTGPHAVTAQLDAAAASLDAAAESRGNELRLRT